MADEIRIPVSADTTPMERNIAEATRRVGTINLNANIDSRGLESLSRPLGKITGQADEFSKSMEAANARVLAFGASVGVINTISNAFKGLVSSTIEVEKSLTEIKIIGNETFSNLNKTSAGLFTTAKQLGVSYKDAADATLEFARQGKGLTESLNASKAALALTRTAGISATEAVMGLTSAVNAFGRGADAYIEYANKMSAVSDAFAVNNKDLIEGLSRSASVAQEAGVSFEQVTALITTLQEKTGRGGAVIGNALKTIFTRVQNPEIIKDLRDLGISVQDAVTGNFLPATQIIQNLANEFEGFDKNLRNSVLLKVGGGFQVDKLAALLNDVKDASGTYQRSLNIATSGSGDILGRVAKLNQTIDSSFTNILTSAKQLGSNIGQIAFSKDFVNILQTGASALSSLNDAIFGGGKDAEDQGSTIGKAILKGIGSAISGPGFALFAGILAKLSLDFAKFSTTGVQTLLGITSKSKEEQLIQTAISKTLSENTRFQNQILGLEGNRVAQAELLLSVIKQQVNETKKLESISKGAAGILYDRGVRLSGGTPEIKNSADGYVPNLVGAIAKERSEAPAGSRIIVDRNFPMGGGQRSTMVYNSNETRIRNFAGTGGDAIIPNYPINSAKGFTPNFAAPKRKVLDIDASRASVAGLTFAGEQKNPGVLEKTKPVTIDDDLLEKYSGSPLLSVLKQFEALKLVNLPVGNVYKFRKGLQGDEKEIKKDFIDKLNLKFRDQIISFLKEEISGLGLASGGGLDENLSKLKLNVIGPSTAGYIFEEILKIPTLTNAEKVAQYANQSDTDFFDIRNLNANFAEAYGLPKRNFDLAEIKFGQKELFDGVSKKFLNEVIFQGGGADPKKFGVKDSNRAASGYIPNFAKKTAGQMKRFPRIEYNLKKSENNKDFLLSPLDEVILNNKIIKEVMPLLAGESPAQYEERALKKYSRFKNSKGLRYSGTSAVDGYLINSNNSVDFLEVKSGGFDIEDVKDKFYRAIFENYGGNNDLSKLLTTNKDSFNITGTLVKSSAKGYIPNFSELTGTGAGMLYQDPNFNELGGGQSGKFLAPKSGEGFGQKIFYKLGSDKINQELQVNKSIKEFEKENPALFAKNAISFTNVGKLLTKNGLAAGFEREVIGGLGVDDFATEAFAKPGQTNPKAGFAFYLSELLAQTGVKNVVGEYRKKYGQDSLRIDDIYAQNFKVNDIMQKLLIDETNKFFSGKKNVKDQDVDNYIRELTGSPLINSLNEKFGSAGGRHTMFDTQGFAKTASRGYIPNFAKMTADILTVSPNVAKMSVDQFIEKYLGSEYSTGLSGTSANVVKLLGAPQQIAEAKRDFIMSMLGPNFLATYERNKEANDSRGALIRDKSRFTGTRKKKQGGFMQAYGTYLQPDLSAALEGTFSGEAKRLTYEELDTKAEKIFEQTNLTPYWNEVLEIMRQVGAAYTDEVFSANQAGVKPNFDYNTFNYAVPGTGDKFGAFKERKNAKNKIKELTGLIRPKLIEGLLEGEKGVQGFVLNQPEYDKGLVQGDYFVLLDPKAAELKKLVSNYLINPDLEPLPLGSDQIKNKINIGEILEILDGTFGSQVGGKGILLDTLKTLRKSSEGNPQLQKFFMDGENRPGAFLVKKTMNQKTRQTSNQLGAFLKPNFPQEIIERMATVLAASYNRDGIFQLSNLDVGYRGQLSYEAYKSDPSIDTFATSPELPSSTKSSVPESLSYKEYNDPTKKSYYDSLATWRYVPKSEGGPNATKYIPVGPPRLVKKASKGYIPNFAGGAIGDAIMREKMQSGLPSSQISLTQDSRLVNNLNPSGFAVINKRDEPNGKVPTNRIADAYRNASRGFIPNFSDRPQLESTLQQAAEQKASTSEAEAALKGSQKKVNEKLQSIAKILEEQIKNSTAFNDANKQALQIALQDKDLRERIKKYSELEGQAKDKLVKDILAQTNLKGRNKIETALSNAEQEYKRREVESKKPETTPQIAPPKAQQKEESAASNAQQEQAKKDATKSFGDLALSAFKFQSVLSATSGFLSVFGKDAEKAGEIINTLGQGAYAATQGLEVFKTITGGRGFGESFKGAFRGALDTVGIGRRDGVTSSGVAALRALGPEGRAKRAAELGVTVAAGGTTAGRNAALASTGRLGGVVAGAGGAMAAAGVAAGVTVAGYLLYKSVDQIGQLLNGSVGRTERAVNAFNDIQEKYNVQLSEKQKATVDRLSELADVSGTSLSGAAVGSGFTFSQVFRSSKAFLGFKDETYKNSIQQQIANSGLNLTEEGNQALAKSLGPLLAPIVTQATNKRGENGLIITAPQGEQDRLIAELFSQKLKRIDEILKEELKKPQVFSEEEIQKIIKEKNLKDTTSTKLSQTGEVTETGSTARQKGIEELRKRRISDITQTAAARAAQETAPESIAAQATLEAQKQAILIQTELLKKRLEITQQIAKIESTIPSALESSLSIQKELLSTNEADKFALDLRLKNLQEERQVRAEIKDLFSTEARDIISKNLDRTAALGVTTPRAQQITGLFDNLQAAQNVEDQKKAYSEIINQLDLSVSRQLAKIESLKIENEELETSIDLNSELIKFNNEEINQLSEVNKQLQQRTTLLQGSLDVINKQSQARRIQAAQAAQERAITEKSNYYYTLQKDIFSAQIEIQNKKLEKAKQELDLRKQLRDLAFEEMQFADKTKTEPRKQYEAGMFAAQSKEADAMTEVRMRNAEKAQAYRQSLYNEISSRTNNLQTMSEASKAAISGNTKELEKLYAQAFGEQAQTFDQKVLTAADQFAQIVVQSAKDSEAIKRGEQPSTSYEAISSGKSLDKIMSGKYGDYKSQTDLTKDLEKLRLLSEEGSGSYSIEEINSKISELENILKQTSQNASEFKKQALKPVTEDETKIAEREARIRKLTQDRLTRAESERTTFSGGFEASKRQINEEIETFNSKLGRDIPMSFRDSMVSAMRELSNPNSTQPLKERLLGVANAFLQKINEAFMTQAANKLTSGIMGVIPGMASGGMIRGGSGSKDDVPAMLMGGEYVVTKDAVKKYGPSFFDALNKGTIKKFASGGWVESDVTKYQDPASVNPYGQRRDQGLSFNENGQVIGMDSYTGTAENKQDAMMRAQSDYYARNAQTGQGGFYMPGEGGMGAIMGQRNLLSFATQQTAGTRFDRISGSGGVGSVDLGAGSSNMSLFALRDQGNSRNAAYLESKQKSLDLYFGGIDAAKEKANREEEIRKEQERIKEEAKKREKEMYKSILTSVVSSLAMAGISKLGTAAMTGGSNAVKAANVDAMNAGGKELSGFDKFKTFAGGIWSGGTINGTNAGGLSNTFNSYGYQSFQGFSQGGQNYLFKGNTPLGGSSYGWEQQYSKPGGYWNSNSVYMRRAAGGYVAGNGMGDNVPTMLNGGEFVISKQAAQNIGTNKLQQINSGVTPDSSEMIAAKLDELVEKLSAVGTLNITVNSDSSGRQQTQEQGGNQDKEAKELARRIKEVVMVVLKDEKRLGGMLR